MYSAFSNIFRIPELKKRVIFTLAMFVIYRIGSHIPIPTVDTALIGRMFDRMSQSAGGAFALVDIFSGGALRRVAIFALGIMPYISASIIMQLMGVVVPAIEKLQKEGAVGRKKITQYTRYLTVVLGAIQSSGMSLWLAKGKQWIELGSDTGAFLPGIPTILAQSLVILSLVTGTIFIMWLGEQITERGIGNGISLLITIGIVSRLPSAMVAIVQRFADLPAPQLTVQLIALSAFIVVVIAGVVQMTQAQRKIPVQYAKRVVGRRVYGGASTFLPLRVNQAGVIPIIFATALLSFPALIAGMFPQVSFLKSFSYNMTRGFWHLLIVVPLIILFTYFYTAITMNPKDVADNMKKYGGFIPGIRPGNKTSEYIDKSLSRLTLAGALFLSAIFILPKMMDIVFHLRIGFGGTALLIVVGVVLDTMKQIESHLLMRHYDGFMKGGKIKARR